MRNLLGVLPGETFISLVLVCNVIWCMPEERLDDSLRPTVDVAVIIPTYNYGHFVANAIESVLQQSVAVREILVVDDGSKDNTAEVVRPYVERGDVRYIPQANSGVSAARNLGIRQSKAEYVAFLDADDWWLPQKVERQLEVFAADPAMGMVTCPAVVEDGGPKRTLSADFSTGDAFLELLCRGNVLGGGSSAVMIRRRCFSDAGQFDPRFVVSQDWDLWMRVARHHRVGSTQEPLMAYRVPPGAQGMSRRTDLMETEMRTILTELLADPALPERIRRISDAILCHHMVIAGKSFLKQGQVGPGLRVLRGAARCSPGAALHSLFQSGRDARRLNPRFFSALSAPQPPRAGAPRRVNRA